MQNDSIQQGPFFKKVIFTLEKDGINVLEKTLSGSHRYHVHYGHIPPRPQELTNKSKGAMVCAVFLSFVAICVLLTVSTDNVWSHSTSAWIKASLLAVLAAATWCFAYFYSTTHLIYVQDGGGVVLCRNKPSAHKVGEFIANLFAARNGYLKSQYTLLSAEEPVPTRLARLNYMLSQEVISEQEFVHLRKEANASINPSSDPVGFAQAAA